MSEARRRRERGRADRIMPGLWRLRLPLPWPGVPHVNAFAIDDADGGIVLVDTGIHEDSAREELDRALDQAGRRLSDVRLLVCTHAHSDHYGLASEVVETAGCELWMHPRHEHMSRAAADPERALERRIEVAQQSGVPLEPLRRWAAERRTQSYGIGGVVLPHRELVDGVKVDTDLGQWVVRETPGHAPSHVCLFQPERRVLLSGDHLLGRVSLYFDFGWTPDPVAEFLSSLDVVEGLGARLCLSGHGRPFTDVQAHIEANRREVRDRLEATERALDDGPLTAFELMPRVFGEHLSEMMSSWALTMALCFLRHLEREQRVQCIPPSNDDEPERWARV